MRGNETSLECSFNLGPAEKQEFQYKYLLCKAFYFDSRKLKFSKNLTRNHVVFVGIPIAMIKHRDQKQLRGDRVCFSL